MPNDLVIFPVGGGGGGSGGGSGGSDTGFQYFDDFIGAAPTPNRLGWTSSGNGAGSGTLLDAAAIAEVSAQRPGILNQSTGTAVGGRGVLNTSIDLLEVPGVGGSLMIEWYVRLSAVPTALEDYFTIVGVGDNTGGGNATDGMYFRADAPGGNYSCVGRRGGVETSVDSGVAISTAWTKFGILVNTSGDANYFINGTLVGTIAAAGIPTTGQRFGLLAKIQKQVGTTPISQFLDYCKAEIKLAVPR